MSATFVDARKKNEIASLIELRECGTLIDTNSCRDNFFFRLPNQRRLAMISVPDSLEPQKGGVKCSKTKVTS